ncbi:MAG: hypothetical protein JST59_17790 [Actinobacteria bacterium]|nr:hypothetical protein [Actinomycetota bacterium]
MKPAKRQRQPPARRLVRGVFSACAALVLLLGAMAGTSGARTGRGVPVPNVFTYEAIHALLIVKDKGTFSESSVKWNGFGRLVQKLGPKELPIVLARGGGTYPVSISAHESVGGDETQTDSGIEDSCSGNWNEGSRYGAISLQLEPLGAQKLKTIWSIPTGFASPRCGRLYDQFGGGIQVVSTVDGHLGDPTLNLQIEGKETETSKSGAYQETVTWDGRVVLGLKEPNH